MKQGNIFEEKEIAIDLILNIYNPWKSFDAFTKHL